MASSSGNVQVLGTAGSSRSSEAAQNAPILDQPLHAEPEAGSSSLSRRHYAEGDTQDQLRDWDDYDSSATPTPTHRGKSHSFLAPSVHPRFSRALSMPLASQLAHLQHPHRPNGSIVHEPLTEADSTELSQFRELSLELADSVQVMIQTMLHVSPPHIFDPAKEQVSACAISIPAPSMSAMFTAMKNLNYISANMSTFLLSGSPDLHAPSTVHHNDFDIGETLQSVGDVLSGAASQSSVELVLYHADVGLKHIWVKGDESGISYLLSHVIRQILSTARRGDSIELGLLVLAASSKRTPLDSQVTDSPVDLDSSLRCTIQVSHKYSLTNSDSITYPRTSPNFSSLLLRRLTRKVDAKLSLDTAAESSTEWACELSFTLERGTTPSSTPPLTQPEVDERQAVEPTIEQLTSFVESLKGKKVTLYASSKGSFANHLTSYLTAWGLDVSHGDADGADSEASSPVTTASIKLPGPQPESPSFIFIDDDVTVLKQRLNTLRMEHPQFNLRKRPSLAPHRNVSSTQITRQYTSSIVLVHFASLCNFKIIRDVIQSILPSYMGSLISVPEVMIIPKPAGPRRLLTALHTALTKPVVDPFFSPIATSPGSPSVVSSGSFMSAHSNTSSPRSPLPHRPSGSRSDSDRSTRSVKDSQDLNPPPPSPLGMPDNVEYFTQTLGVSPSSGYVIQSPDGKTTGIYFHPNSKAGPPRLPSGTIDKSLISSNLPTTRSPIPTNAPITFSSLHEVSQSRSPSLPSVTTAVRTPPTDPDKSPSALRKTSPSIPSSSEVKTIPPLLKSLGRRTTSSSSSKTQNTSPNKKAKVPDETKIVPPVSVLIVDDNPINQTILSTFMKKKRIKYDVASNGAEAVQKWRSGEFHLILMDIQMPIMDGIEATKEIRRLERSFAMEGYISEDHQSVSPLGTPSESSEPKPSPHRTSVIIVALTASSLQSDRVAALAAGCNDFLTKPVHLPWLNNKIIEWGSIKALQMWADPGREILDSQAAQAQTVAERLHVPLRKSPSLAQQSVNTPSSPAPPNSALSAASPTWMNGQVSPGYAAGLPPAQEKPTGPDPDRTSPTSPGPH